MSISVIIRWCYPTVRNCFLLLKYVFDLFSPWRCGIVTTYIERPLAFGFKLSVRNKFKDLLFRLVLLKTNWIVDNNVELCIDKQGCFWRYESWCNSPPLVFGDFRVGCAFVIFTARGSVWSRHSIESSIYVCWPGDSPWDRTSPRIMLPMRVASYGLETSAKSQLTQTGRMYTFRTKTGPLWVSELWNAWDGLRRRDLKVCSSASVIDFRIFSVWLDCLIWINTLSETQKSGP